MGKDNTLLDKFPSSITSPDKPASLSITASISFADKKLESNAVFPSDPKSAYLSSYFQDSFDFPYNPDPLASGNNYKIYDEMKHDDQVKAAVSFKKDLVVSSGWKIICDNQEIVDRITYNLSQDLKGISFENSIKDIMSAFEYGFSLTEVLYRRAEDGKIEIKEFKTRPPHTFEFHSDPKGDVKHIIQHSDQTPLDFKPDYFIHHIYQPEFGNPYGQSDLRSAFTPWKTKKFILRFYAIYLERYAAPTIVAEYPEDFDANKVGRLQTIVNTIQNSTAFVVPEGTKIDFKMAQRDSSDSYEKAINLLNTMVARAILMPDLMGVSGSKTSGGSYALGETQFEMFLGLIRREQQSLARAITLKVIRPLVKANWGDIPCEFQFNQHSQEDTMEALRVWIEATKSRLWKPEEDEIKHVLEKLNFPIPDKVNIPESLPMPVVGAPDQDPNDPDAPKNKGPIPPKKENEPKEDDSEKKDKAFRQFVNKRHRDFTRFEKVLDFAEIESSLDRQEEKEINRLRPLARDIYLDFIEQIKERNLLGRFRPELINQLKIRQQKPMNMELKSYMRDGFIDAYNMAQKEIFPRMDAKFALEEELIPESFLEIIEADSFKMVGDYSINITKRMRDRLIEGIKNGVNERELLRQLRELGENETDKWLKTAIRTKTTEMLNRGRKSYWDNDEMAKQIIEAYQYSAILDDRTSEICRYLDGKIFEKGSLTTSINPPAHLNCRSLLVPITKFEDYKREKMYVPPTEEPTVDQLRDKGGNLIFAQEFLSDISSSGTITAFGDTTVIAAPGKGKSVHVTSLYVANMSQSDRIVVGFRNTTEMELRYKKTLLPNENMPISFSETHWVLPENIGLIINKTTDFEISYTCQYQIYDKAGKRIG